jgi:hypothetical protein
MFLLFVFFGLKCGAESLSRFWREEGIGNGAIWETGLPDGKFLNQKSQLG